jgi:hypothetical protein
MSNKQLFVGDHVRDRDSDEDDEDTTMVVVGLTGERADDVTFDGETTIASVNEDYPADDPVIEVSFTRRTLTDLSDVSRYSYPRSRLERVACVHQLDDENEDDDEESVVGDAYDHADDPTMSEEELSELEAELDL